MASVLNVTMDESGNIVVKVQGAYADGTDRTILLDMGKVSSANKVYAAFHGIKQRLVDAAALSRDTKTGKAASPMEKADAIAEIVEHLESGTEKWSRVATSAGAKGGFLFEALCAFNPTETPENIRKFLEGLTAQQQSALRDDDEVAPHIARIKREKAEKAGDAKPDTKALLAGLKAAPVPADAEAPAPDVAPEA